MVGDQTVDSNYLQRAKIGQKDNFQPVGHFEGDLQPWRAIIRLCSQEKTSVHAAQQPTIDQHATQLYLCKPVHLFQNCPL